jgi:hypothetical protein
MTDATLKALIDVYVTLIRAGWGDPEDEGAEPRLPGRETAEQPSEVEQPMESPATHASLETQKHELRT